MTPTVAAAAMPAPAAKPATDWTKWGLIGMGALALGIVAYLALRPKPRRQRRTPQSPRSVGLSFARRRSVGSRR
jgi:hypothetical protein